MAFQRTLAQRLFNISKKSNTILANCRISSSAVQASIPPNPARVAPDPGDEGVFRRFLQWRPIYQLRGMDISRERIRLDGLSPPPPSTASETSAERKLTVGDARKLLRVSQLEMVKSNLRQITKDHISFDEFVEICSGGCSNAEQGLQFAKMLDESGTVIVLGNVVFLRPDQVGIFFVFSSSVFYQSNMHIHISITWFDFKFLLIFLIFGHFTLRTTEN
ncbi:hypothetical protein CsSME_00003873 [Camellia sinensis var. sinensis]